MKWPWNIWVKFADHKKLQQKVNHALFDMLFTNEISVFRNYFSQHFSSAYDIIMYSLAIIVQPFKKYQFFIIHNSK